MAMETGSKSRILVIGATGTLGRNLVRASLAAGHSTFALVREPAFSDPQKSLLLRSFSADGVNILKGSLQDFQSLLEAVKQVDVVICAVPSNQTLNQKLLIQAIKEAGCIKRFVPSEFGADPDKVQILGMDHGHYEMKTEIRRCIENEGIPYTYISCNLLMRYLLPSLVQPGLNAPPRDKITIFGDGNVKAVSIMDIDVATFTICTIDDPRTLDTVLYLRPPGNVYSMNELVEMWEMKIGKMLEKVYVPEEQLLRIIQETPFPSNRHFIFIYSAFIKGDHTYFSIDSSGLDGCKLYPHVKYTTVSEYLDSLL
ncbi:probable pinoresinol-lariciresinol reductase 3 isoform X1 [Elaeis guineensis]|uniref:Probable pinoresinol-lariciresinol reductase 3 isoform X1 n=1 Tax=Elaeis guineensis var. tenera TaxID=51953 RepID=A0A6I9QB89_ELAGV|nr:probable pinoresinol-lariciresinol reductase 3 isoform X1 [Elaeis guineensis]